MSERQFHRIRHYPGTFSTFDMVEECTKGQKGKPCLGCQYDHALCDERGRVLDLEKERAKMAREPRYAGGR